ncbi:MAG: ABC transporter ATP-binding protein [Pseudomonadota bacterium]
MDGYHDLLHWISHAIGHHLGDETPAWLHPVLHVVLIWAPIALLSVIGLRVIALVRRRRRDRPTRGVASASVPGLPTSVFRFVLRFSPRQQGALMLAGLLSMPVLYATLELPKIIINNAIESGHFPIERFGQTLSQFEFLFALCALYLIAILVNGAIKFGINVYKGRVGERLLRRLRLTIFRRWRHGAGAQERSQVIPIIAQEVEPIGGFASDAVALPVFQGGTFATILFFMFMQDPVLGAAALTMLPLQLYLIPKLQRRVNRLARRRVKEIRTLSGRLGQQSSQRSLNPNSVRQVGSSLRRIEDTRRQIHRAKFFMKALNNFLTALTPFFFYSIGGYLVIEERLTLGALVAVLAAYKDFSAPLRELFRYYQTIEDVRIRYDEVGRYLMERAARPIQDGMSADEQWHAQPPPERRHSDGLLAAGGA